MREIVRGASVAFLLKVLGAGLNFAFTVLLARTLNAKGVGIYFLALTVTTIAATFGHVGLPNALLRFTASNASKGVWTAVKGVYRKSMKIALVTSIVAAGTMMLMAPWLAFSLFSKPGLVSPIRWMSLAVVPVVIYTLHAEGLKGLKRIRDSQFVNGVSVSAFSLLGLFFLGEAYGVNGAIWAYAIAAFITSLIAYSLWRRATSKATAFKGKFSTRRLLESSMPLFWMALLNLVMNWTAVFMLGIWGTKADVGIFGVANRTAMLTSFILISVNSIAAPKFAVLYANKELEELGSTARNSAKLIAIMASPLFLLALLFPEWVMGLFGAEFKEGALLLIVLTIGQIVNVVTGSVVYLLLMSGNESLMRNNTAFVVMVSLVLNSILIPSIGVMGAAIATTVSLSLKNIIAVYFVWTRLKVWTIPFLKKKSA